MFSGPCQPFKLCEKEVHRVSTEENCRVFQTKDALHILAPSWDLNPNDERLLGSKNANFWRHGVWGMLDSPMTSIMSQLRGNIHFCRVRVDRTRGIGCIFGGWPKFWSRVFSVPLSPLGTTEIGSLLRGMLMDRPALHDLNQPKKMMVWRILRKNR